MRREVRLEVIYPHPPERVWKALTDPGALATWLMPNDFLPRLGHRFRFVEKTPGKPRREVVQCEVVELEEPHRLAHTCPTGPTCPAEFVCWTLEPVEAGTRVRLEHIALEDAAAPFTACLHSRRPMRLQSRLAAYLKKAKGERRKAKVVRYRTLYRTPEYLNT